MQLPDMAKANIKLLIAYSGTDYFGWQKTRMGPSIEECLEKALETILQEEISLQAASRTDRGVHAEGQVVNFFTKKEELDLGKLKNSLNALLPKDITVLHIERMDPDFHPTLHCIGKEYQYQICMGQVQLPFFRHHSWHVRHDLQIEEMRRIKDLLLGTHDFSCFCNEQALSLHKSSICTLREIAIVPQEKNRLLISVIGDRFLYKMVRNLVGTLVYIGSGKIAGSSLASILKNRDRKQAGVTAPAHGLSLKQLFYSHCRETSSPLELRHDFAK